MLTIAKNEILKGLKDAKFLFLSVLIILSFIINAVVYSERYHNGMDDYQTSIRTLNNELDEQAGSLLDITTFRQRVVRPPSPLAFIADGGEVRIPNSWAVDAFHYANPEIKSRNNEQLPFLISLDWAFIIGSLMTLLTLMISYGAVCGEKKNGTLRMILSNPISRLQLFLGKYIGLLIVVSLALFVGIAINLILLSFNSALPATFEVAERIGWTIVLAILCLSCVLFFGMAVSAMVRIPAVSLVILIIGWIIGTIIVPGMGRLFAEQSVSIKDSHEVEIEIDTQQEAILRDSPPRTLFWNGDPRGETIHLRANYYRAITAMRERIMNEAYDQRVRQGRTINSLSSVSPTGLLTYSLQDLCETGISGYENTLNLVRRYQGQLHQYTAELDRRDSDSPHHVYSWNFRTESGVFSVKPVEMSSFPRFHSLLLQSGLSSLTTWPMMPIITFLLVNLQLAIVAFIALFRYDPR